MSVIEALHQARKARLKRIAARAIAQSPESASTPTALRGSGSEPDRDYEHAWALEILGVGDRWQHRPRVKDIQCAVARHFGVRCEDIVSTDRAHVALPRHVAMYLARALTPKSFPEIGRCFARNHSTVLQAVRRIEGLLAHDAELAASIDRIRDMLDA